MRNSVIQVNGRAAGRPAEISTLSEDVISWDESMMCAVALWPQFKGHTFKTVLLTAGANRHICPLNALGSAYAAGCFKDHQYAAADLNYMYTGLVQARAPSTSISSWLKQLAPGATNTTYKIHHVDSPPADVVAAGRSFIISILLLIFIC